MKRNFLKLTGIALVSSLALTACHPDKIKDEPGMALILANAITSSASGACLLNVNGASLYYGHILFNTINNTAGNGFTRADYDLATGNTGTATTAAAFALLGYEEKFRAFFLDNGTTWSTTLRNTRLATVKATIDGNGLGTATLAQLPTTGIMACAKIPKTSCSVAGLTTADRATDITTQIANYNAVVNNSDCRKPSATFTTMLAKSMFRGTPSTTALALSTGSIFNTPTNGIPVTTGVGPTSAATILAEGMYPKSGALVVLWFGSIMAINKIGGAYPTTTSSTTTTAFYGGSNLTVTPVPSCEAYGFHYGFTPDANEALRKPLTSASEIAYSFSTNGSAAAAYQAAIQLATIDQDSYITTATAGNIQDAVACNNSFRSKTTIAMALGGGKYPTTNGGAQSLAAGDGKGDDRASSLVSVCVYGGTTTKRAILAGTVGSATLVAGGVIGITGQVSTCGEGHLASQNALQASAAAATGFTEVGTFSTFPNSN